MDTPYRYRRDVPIKNEMGRIPDHGNVWGLMWGYGELGRVKTKREMANLSFEF